MNTTGITKNNNQPLSRKEKNKNPYEQFTASELILRDQLAIDRTVLANERTFLAYCRTALALIITGAGVIKFFESGLWQIAGWVLIGLGLLIIIIGVWRSSSMARNIATAGRGMQGVRHGAHVSAPDNESEDAYAKNRAE